MTAISASLCWLYAGYQSRKLLTRSPPLHDPISPPASVLPSISQGVLSTPVSRQAASRAAGMSHSRTANLSRISRQNPANSTEPYTLHQADPIVTLDRGVLPNAQRKSTSTGLPGKTPVRRSLSQFSKPLVPSLDLMNEAADASLMQMARPRKGKTAPGLPKLPQTMTASVTKVSVPESQVNAKRWSIPTLPVLPEINKKWLWPCWERGCSSLLHCVTSGGLETEFLCTIFCSVPLPFAACFFLTWAMSTLSLSENVSYSVPKFHLLSLRLCLCIAFS